MNYPESQYKKLVSDLPKLIGAYNLDKETALKNLHQLHFKMYVNKNYSDDNLNVKRIDNKRLFNIDTDFLLYPERCNDNQIETAMKKAIKEIYSNQN